MQYVHFSEIKVARRKDSILRRHFVLCASHLLIDSDSERTRLQYGKNQETETLINEEALPLPQYLKNEKQA